MRRILLTAAIVVLIGLGLDGCHKKNDTTVPVDSNPPATTPPPSTTPVVTQPQTPAVPTVTLPPNDNDVPTHVTIPPPAKK
jgi:hypothetical protein